MEIFGFTPHRGQEKVIDVILNDSFKYITVVSPRQTGKSMLLLNLIMYFAINDKSNPTIGVITPVYSQAKKIIDDLVEAIQDSGIIKSKNLSNFEIKLNTGATVKFLSSERPDSIRGNTFDYALLDETAYQKEEAWKNAIQPTVLVKGKKVVLFSTPRGTKNWFYDMYQMGLDNEYPTYASVRMEQGDNPLIDQSEIELAKKALPDAIYRAEYQGEFVEGESMVFNTFKACISNVTSTSKDIYCGVDLARNGDYTVATFIDSNGVVVDILKINGTSWENIVDQLVIKLKQWNAKALVEINSIGDVVFELIKKRYQKVTPFTTSNQSKKDIIEHLILSFSNKAIHIPNNKELIQELEVFEMTYNPSTRTVRYAARPPFHDDMVISLALANYHRETGKNIGVYAVKGM